MFHAVKNDNNRFGVNLTFLRFNKDAKTEVSVNLVILLHIVES